MKIHDVLHICNLQANVTVGSATCSGVQIHHPRKKETHAEHWPNSNPLPGWH